MAIEQDAIAAAKTLLETAGIDGVKIDGHQIKKYPDGIRIFNPKWEVIASSLKIDDKKLNPDKEGFLEKLVKGNASTDIPTAPQPNP